MTLSSGLRDRDALAALHGKRRLTARLRHRRFTDPWTSASTLLLLHAAMGHSGRYYAWVPRLSRHYRVVRMDLRGHGASGVPPADPPLTMQRLVKDTAELLDHLGCKSAHIVGNSAGGYVGQNLAMTSPERVRSLLLFGSTPGLKHSQAANWLPQVRKEELRNFLAARFPIAFRSIVPIRATSNGFSMRPRKTTRRSSRASSA
jgi:pimeloyl-ACP methyl ester carboxylesterase